MKRLLIILAFLLVAVPGIAADTGTYSIEDYRVVIAPRPDGKVQIYYYMKWSVTGGHIPWITVGLPNNAFTIDNYGYAAQYVSRENQKDWIGVRLDLDRDYLPGESFQVSFQITQNNLIYARKNDYKLDFTPGWYDNAGIKRLIVMFHLPGNLNEIKTKPKISSIGNEVMTWEKINLKKGKKFKISVSFPKTTFGTPIPNGNLRQSTAPDLKTIGTVILVIVVIIVFVTSGTNQYSGGSMYYGGHNNYHSSCACACVSCACACACAGGGGAGCSRKMQHSCSLCRERNKE